MNEYASRFHILLDHASTLDNRRQLRHITASIYPNLSREEQRSITKALTPKDDAIIDVEGDRKRLRKLLSGIHGRR